MILCSLPTVATDIQEATNVCLDRSKGRTVSLFVNLRSARREAVVDHMESLDARN